MIDRIILFPYSLTLAARNAMYNSGMLKSVSAEVPTICIGNITAGGTGKTPHTEMVLRMLAASDEWKDRNVAVLSRGYKRRSKGFQKVTAGGTADMFGDEPLQIAKKFPSVTVAVDRDRIEGCDFLCHPDRLATSRKARKCLDKDVPKADIIVLDDAFQYRKLKASLNILLVDFNRPVSKDKLLPIGRLRDLPSRVHDADIIIVTKCPLQLDEWEKGKWAQRLGIYDYSTSSCKGHDRSGKEQTLLFSCLEHKPMLPVFPEGDMRYTYSKRLILFTGIADDRPLRNYLSGDYKIISHFNFADHHRYSSGDMASVNRAAKEWQTAVVATTEKDAQRVADAKKVPEFLKERMFQVPVEVSFLSLTEEEVFRTTMLSFLK